ncbi:hypothetical protein D6825_01960 [Candidatus Woesearchaeota archaeon]|nr:MAG: hypothetical protein D6825_01960 [Candidatus Woesearchaeota archaeon]
MIKQTIFLIIAAILSATALAHGAGHEQSLLSTAEDIIKSGKACSELTDDELELIGDYYMEQMHPGEMHERMDAMMGGEGSLQLREAHINMARKLYCNEYPSYGMMTMMGGGMRMMQNYGYGMMGGYGMWLGGLLWIALAAFVFGVVFWLTYKLIIGVDKHKK